MLGPNAGFMIVFLSVFALAIAGNVYWIVTLVRVCKIPDYQYRAAGTDKTTWVLIVALLGFVGALVWRFAKRDVVLAAAGRIPAPPPGWYPDASTGAFRWWDGIAWSAVHQYPPRPGS